MDDIFNDSSLNQNLLTITKENRVSIYSNNSSLEQIQNRMIEVNGLNIIQKTFLCCFKKRIAKYCINTISTTKYNWFTFLPKNLFH